MPTNLFTSPPVSQQMSGDTPTVVPVVTPVADLIKPPEPEPTGLDKWAKLAENKYSKTTPDKPPVVFDPVAILKDPEALENISNSIDFTASITAETQQKLADNAPDAIASMVNDVGKAALLQALQYSTALNQQHVEDRFSQQKDETRGDIASGLTNYELERALPEIKNPIIQLGVKHFIGTLREQNPTITGEGIADEVRSYLKEASAALNPEKVPKGDESKKVTDWFAEMDL